MLEPKAGAPEAWISGRFAHLAPVPRLLCCSLELSLADLEKWIEPLPDDLVWVKPAGLASVGFQLRHLAGSTARLLTYAREEALTTEQIVFMKAEMEPGAKLEELLSAVRESYEAAAGFAAALPAPELDKPRFIGRARMETVLGVLIAHMAEHAQRHTGQAITTAKVVRALGPAPRRE